MRRSCKLQTMTDSDDCDIHSSSNSIRDSKALWDQRKNTVQPKLLFNIVRAIINWEFPYIMILGIENTTTLSLCHWLFLMLFPSPALFVFSYFLLYVDSLVYIFTPLWLSALSPLCMDSSVKPRYRFTLSPTVSSLQHTLTPSLYLLLCFVELTQRLCELQ